MACPVHTDVSLLRWTQTVWTLSCIDSFCPGASHLVGGDAAVPAGSHARLLSLPHPSDVPQADVSRILSVDLLPQKSCWISQKYLLIVFSGTFLFLKSINFYMVLQQI